MDDKVLAAQKWVNKTYAGVSGYTRCPEDGRTGWATMYSLTMGLQKELGISPVVANFGAGTLAKLTAHGSIGPDEPNVNIRKIVQHAMFCKGYWGGDGEGNFDLLMAESVAAFKTDAGLGETSGMVQPKIFKALLTMDAYVLLAGGSEKVQSIQRWLNGRYVNKSTFFIGPCDGHFSRDVQQALMKAIQYEVGIPEDQATGVFGPGTQAGLKSHPVAQGDSGIFVQLFSAACVFNEPVNDGVSTYVTSFKSAFDSSLKEFVEQFQRFSVLDVTGRGDYQTWAQLLISTGDPERPVDASDTRYTITASRAKALYDAGYRAVGRYLYQPPDSIDKYIKPGELQDMFSAGLRVVPIFQDNGRLLSDFTYTKGFQHGLLAHERATFYGYNRSTVIYFAVDYDATNDQIASNIIPYFNGVSAGLANKGKRFVHGVYGSRNVCAQVTKETYARHSYVSGMSTGFSGNLGFPLPANWAFNQIKEFKFAPDFDLDKVAHRAGTDFGQGSVNKQTSPADDFIAYIERLYGLAVDYGKGDPSRLVMEYVRHVTYANFAWWALIGDPDKDFIKYANGRDAFVWDEFKDPFTGYHIGAEHMLATCNAHYVKPQPSNPLRVNAGDVGGWGGDIITLYGEWRRDSDSYSSGYTYCEDKFAKIGVDSTFGFNDLLEDADGYLISERVRGGQDIVTAVRNHYRGSGGLTRIGDFLTKRFSGLASTATDMARNMLTMSDDPTIALGRAKLIYGIAGYDTLLPEMLPADKLTEFCRGFADSLLARAGQEGLKKATYLANQKKNLRDSQ
ncbi:glycoside hydrolase domain-containing protein [Streptomyces antimycoticus]|uniref:Glycoside hydrolase domain-containing protein n=1 Tax=Streptomyces antimycoticus TaxID=68175 RepID=A0ABD5JPC2_9ACTN|nr:glycoside hydrolase domain-containing protein [Streptomyces sp. DSM 41602]